MEKHILEKKIVAGISIFSNTTLILLKLIAGVISGSIGILSEAIHSGSDLFASVITYFSINESSKPADEDHQYGHGKYEDFAGFIEGFLIILAALYIVYEAVKKLIHPAENIINADLGLYVMAFSVFANIIVSYFLFKVAKKTDSVALYADGEHLRTDVYSSLAVFVGLLLVKFTGNPVFDPIVAIAVAIIIFAAGYKICITTRDNLLDTSLCNGDTILINEVMQEYIGEKVIGLKACRTRKAGVKKNIELTLIVDKQMTVEYAHNLCDEIEEKIDVVLKNTDITIHVEPDS